MNFKYEIAKFASVPGNQILASPKAEMGDFCLPCFSMAKLENQRPDLYAKNLMEKLSTKKNYLIEKMETMGGYLNFFINKNIAAEKTIQNILSTDFKYKNIGNGKTICIDYCSANLAKYLHIGHISTTMIGESLHRIYKALGYKVVRINYLGDYGTTFGKMVVAIQLWGNMNDVKSRGVEAIQDLYIKFSAEENDDLMDKARFASRQIEEKKGAEYEIYKTIIDIAIKECKRIIKMIGVDFDDWRGESFYADKTDSAVAELKEKNISKTENGAELVDLSEYNLPPAVVRRSDGGSVYLARDLCAVKDRFDLYKFDEMLYVVAMQHNTYFAQLFKILELLNRPYAKKLKHINFGMFSVPEGKIASRKGKQALFVDIFQKAYDEAEKIIKDRNFDEEYKKETSAKIAKSVIAFSILKVERAKDKVFDIKTAVSFEGETAPYIQYTYARCCSLIENFEKTFQKLNLKNSTTEKKSETEKRQCAENEKVNQAYNNFFEIFKIIANFDETVLQAKEKAEPCLIARELIGLCKEFNKFYQEIKIINDDFFESSCLMRIILAVKKILEFGMPLVVVDIIEKM
ncbi:MAG: arginine--tRNA ligase [Clostridia bacterium]|jgi:arginyl-tRNA synthetase|nr:arginine--tRNA ligase [Clostridia bacterium]MDD3232187.1 arginine--tRNA ligase [Clostridia bacterium]